VRTALDRAAWGSVVHTGRIVGAGSGRELLARDMFRQAFLGIKTVSRILQTIPAPPRQYSPTGPNQIPDFFLHLAFVNS